MSNTIRVPVTGQNPPCYNRERVYQKRQMLKLKREQSRNVGKNITFISYENSYVKDNDIDLLDDDSDFTDKDIKFLKSSKNIIDFVKANEMNTHDKRSINLKQMLKSFLAQDVVTEHPVALGGNYNKVYCSIWLNDRSVLLGTKCNKLLVHDMKRRCVIEIPCVPSIGTMPQDEEGGIHMMVTNPSKTLVATGGANPSEMAVYTMPDMKPHAIGAGAHSDWIFDGTWLDDQFIVTGSRDSTIALWRIKENDDKPFASLYPVSSPLTVAKCEQSAKVRGVTYNKAFGELACLSLNGGLHLWDVEQFRQTHSRKLPCNQDTVSIISNELGTLYAIACKTYVLLMDPRCLQATKKIVTRQTGVRSISIMEDLLTMGTGSGVIQFYDLTAGKYLVSTTNAKRSSNLYASRGFLHPDHYEPPMGITQGSCYHPAIYSHCYDERKSRLFAAGGPLPSSNYGNYAAFWL